jgi:hypothetical protein
MLDRINEYTDQKRWIINFFYTGDVATINWTDDVTIVRSCLVHIRQKRGRRDRLNSVVVFYERSAALTVFHEEVAV